MADITVILKNKDGFISLNRPAPIEEIKNAEAELNVRFSEEYKKYVLEFGAASFIGHELTGICTVKAYDVINVTKQAREEFPDGSNNRYVVEYTGVDNIYIWQDTKGYVYCGDEKIYDSLVEYIEAE